MVDNEEKNEHSDKFVRMSDYHNRPTFHCDYCGCNFRGKSMFHEENVAFFARHIEQCGIRFSPEDEDETYVRCKICTLGSSRLKQHLRKEHNLSPEEYKQAFPGALTVSRQTSKNYGSTGNFNWIKRANDAGDDLSEYKEKMGKAVSAAIMSKPEERARRSRQLGINNQTPEARQKASDTAKRTSSREDILSARTLRMHTNRKPSIPEKILFPILEPFGFKRNQSIKDEVAFTTKTHRRVLDFFRKEDKLIVEFDGGQHFCDAFKNFSKVYSSDEELNAWVDENQYCLIRISYEKFSYKTHTFNDEALQRLFELIQNPTPGVHFIGDAYNKNK